MCRQLYTRHVPRWKAHGIVWSFVRTTNRVTSLWKGYQKLSIWVGDFANMQHTGKQPTEVHIRLTCHSYTHKPMLLLHQEEKTGVLTMGIKNSPPLLSVTRCVWIPVNKTLGYAQSMWVMVFARCTFSLSTFVCFFSIQARMHLVQWALLWYDLFTHFIVSVFDFSIWPIEVASESTFECHVAAFEQNRTSVPRLRSVFDVCPSSGPLNGVAQRGCVTLSPTADPNRNNVSRLKMMPLPPL